MLCLGLVIRARFAGAAECMIGVSSTLADSFVLTDLTHESQDNIYFIHVCCESNLIKSIVEWTTGEIKRHDWSEHSVVRAKFTSRFAGTSVRGIEQTPLQLEVDVSKVAEEILSIRKTV